MALPSHVKIVEVGPRDGLQNEKKILPSDIKVQLIERLAKTGLQAIEATAFVSPKWVPQMADNQLVMQQIVRQVNVSYPVLTPNLQGFQAALATGATEVAVFAAASESFSQKNINCSIDESIERFVPVIEAAKASGIAVRGYVSCMAGCPYENAIAPEQVAYVAKTLYDLGCYEISLGDTIGVGTPNVIQKVIETVSKDVPIDALAGHYHNTYGMALTNIYHSLQMGMHVFDASVAGLGGCPYAKGASGNAATEDVVYLLNGLGIQTGVDLDKLVEISWWISEQLGQEPASNVARAWQAQ